MTQRNSSPISSDSPDQSAWGVHRSGLHHDEAFADASRFALGNGYIGVRGTPDEGFAGDTDPHAGTYLNGFHETHDIHYPEDAYGFARTAQTLLNVTHATPIALQLDGVEVHPDLPNVEDYHQTLDFEGGVLQRSYTWRAADGARTLITFTRVVSLAHRNRMGTRLTLTPLDREVSMHLTHSLDANVRNRTSAGDPRVGAGLKGVVLTPVAHHAEDSGRRHLQHRAPNSGMELICASELHARRNGKSIPVDVTTHAEPMHANADIRHPLACGETLEIDLHTVYFDTRDHPSGELVARAQDELDTYQSSGGIDTVLAIQARELDAFWRSAHIEIEGDASATESVRFALFQLLQSGGRDGRTNLPAKGLSGEGYEGHTFWDSEIYMVPTLLYTAPKLARALLHNRISMLDAARARAQELGHPGILFPWRTIAGPEASAYFPAGTAQIHINADVVHALARYLTATGDETLLLDGGIEVAIEVARFYRSVGQYGRDGAFHVHTVTGPDEYTALVDDNHYTNRMAQFALGFAADMVERCTREGAANLAELAQRLQLDLDAEPASWRAAADAMHLPVDPHQGVTPQDSSFLGKPEWPWDETPKETYPLLLHVHPLDIYRHQVLKQADVLLAHYLLPDGVTRTQKRRDEAYYAPRTTHDSSLSPFVHAITAADLGKMEAALAHYQHSARLDLDDLHGNTGDGLHAAAMAGTWLATVEGFGGFRVLGQQPSFHPRLPGDWNRLRFRIAWRQRILEIDIEPSVTHYRLIEGEALGILHRGETVLVTPENEVQLPSQATLRGVIFDLDGVITDSAEYHYQAWQALADELNIPFDREANEALRGLPRMASLDAILARGNLTLHDDEKHALANKKNAHYLTLIENVTPQDLLPGIGALLQSLRQEGVKLALASSSRNGPFLLERLGIADAFDAIIDPATLRFGKPDPEIFECAAERLGLPVEDCVGVEDAESGLAAIQGAGMAAVAVGTSENLQGADVQVASTHDLTLDVLRSALARHTHPQATHSIEEGQA